MTFPFSSSMHLFGFVIVGVIIEFVFQVGNPKWFIIQSTRKVIEKSVGDLCLFNDLHAFA